MSTQEFLTLLFEVIALSFFALISFEFVAGLMLLHQPILATEIVDKQQRVKLLEPTTEAQSQLDLLQQQEADIMPLVNASDLRAQSKIAALKLRDARIVAKELDITQKANGKDKSLEQLQREIEQKLTSDRASVVEALQQKAS